MDLGEILIWRDFFKFTVYNSCGAMECVNLLKERHKLCTDEDNKTMYDSQGNFLVYDVIGNNKFVVNLHILIYTYL